MRIVDVPLEPLEERYTEQWRRWFGDYYLERYSKFGVLRLNERGPRGGVRQLSIDHNGDDSIGGIDFECLRIDASSSGGIQRGKVLDATGTIYFKAEQIATIARGFEQGMFKDGDCFFLHDLQFPGWEAILYMAHLCGVKVKVYGFLHASSWTRGDFAEPMAGFLRPHEYGWLNNAAGIFVGSDYHNRRICSIFDASGELGLADKIYTTGNPIRAAEYRDRAIAYDGTENNSRERADSSRPDGVDRNNNVIWPHRFHHEKDPFFAVDVVDWMLWNGHDITFTFLNTPEVSNDPNLIVALNRLDRFGDKIRCVGIESKDHYYHELSQAAVVWSSSPEESFGYCNVEGIALGCHPVMTACAAHPEIVQFNERYLYAPGDIEGCSEKILEGINSPSPPTIYIERYEKVINEIMAIIRDDN